MSLFYIEVTGKPSRTETKTVCSVYKEEEVFAQAASFRMPLPVYTCENSLCKNARICYIFQAGLKAVCMAGRPDRKPEVFDMHKKSLSFISRLIAVLMFGVAFATFQIQKGQLTDVYYLMAGILTAGGLALFTGKPFRAFRSGKVLSTNILCGILSLLCLATQTVFSMPEAALWDTLKSNAWAMIYVVLLIVFAFVGIDCLLLSALTCVRREEDGKELVRTRRVCFALIAVVSVMFLCSSYPGWDYPDIQTAWIQAAYGEWDEWHTIGFLYFVKLCSFLWQETFVVSIVQTVLWLLVNHAALMTISEMKRPGAIRLYTVLSLLLFTPYIYLQAMMKDTIFAICMLALCVALWRLVTKEHLKITDIVFLTVFALGVSLFRHGGVVVAVIALLIAVLVRIRLHLGEIVKPSVSLGVLLLGYFLLVVVLGRNVLQANPNPPYIKYTVPFYMAGELLADDQVEMDEEDISFLEEFAEIDDWNALHSKYYADPVAREYGLLGDIGFMEEEEYGPQIMALNLKYFLRCPGRYLTHYSHITSILWQAARPADGYEWGPIEGMATDYEMGIASVKPNWFTTVTRSVSNLSGEIPPFRSIMWRGGFIQFCYFALICFLVKNKGKRFVVPALPIVFFQASLYLSIPSQDPRYVLAMIAAFPFFAVMSMGILGEKNEQAGLSRS